MVVKIAQAVRKHIPEIVELETMEHGSPTWLAEQMLKFAAGNIEYAAAISRNNLGDVLPPFLNMGEPGQNDPNTVAYLKREPIGVCALITPWNVPSR